MLAALSLADRGLAERIVQETFRHGGTDGASARNGDSKESRKAAEERAKVVTAEIRDKVLATVEACREMLAKEPPERMTEYWGTVRSFPATLFFYVSSPLKRLRLLPAYHPAAIGFPCSNPPTSQINRPLKKKKNLN